MGTGAAVRSTGTAPWLRLSVTNHIILAATLLWSHRRLSYERTLPRRRGSSHGAHRTARPHGIGRPDEGTTKQHRWPDAPVCHRWQRYTKIRSILHVYAVQSPQCVGVHVCLYTPHACVSECVCVRVCARVCVCV